MTDHEFFLKNRDFFRQVFLNRAQDDAIEYVAKLSFLQGQLHEYLTVSKLVLVQNDEATKE